MSGAPNSDGWDDEGYWHGTRSALGFIRANRIVLPLYFAIFGGFAFFFLALLWGVTATVVGLAVLIGATLAIVKTVELAKGTSSRQDVSDAPGGD